MNVYINYLKGFWQIGVPVWVLLLIIDFIKPGFVLNYINLLAVFIILIIVWIIDLWISK